jgi:hypothetical protein
MSRDAPCANSEFVKSEIWKFWKKHVKFPKVDFSKNTNLLSQSLQRTEQNQKSVLWDRRLEKSNQI